MGAVTGRSAERLSSVPAADQTKAPVNPFIILGVSVEQRVDLRAFPAPGQQLVIGLRITPACARRPQIEKMRDPRFLFGFSEAAVGNADRVINDRNDDPIE